MKWPQSYTAEGFGAIGCRPGQRGPRGSNLSNAQPTPSRTACTPAGPGAQRQRRPNHPAARVGGRGGQHRQRLGRFSGGVHAHQPRHETTAAGRLGDLLQCPPLGGAGKRRGRVHHRGRDSRPAPPRAGSGLRWAGAGCEHSDPVPHRPAPEPQLRSAGPLHRLRRREGRGRPPERLRRPALRTAPAGHDPRVVTPENQFALDSATRAIPASELPPVFPTPVEVTAGAGTLRLTALPSVEAAEALKNEAAFAAEYLRPYFGTTRKAGVPPLRLEVSPVAGQASPEAYTLVVDSVQGIRIVGASPAGVFYGLQSLRSLLPVPTPRAGLVLPAIRVVDAPRFGYRGFLLDVARNFHPKPAVLRMLDLIARYKLNVFHLHLTDV